MEKFKKILKSIFSFKLIILVIVIVLIIFIILSSGFYFITIDDGEWEDAELGNPSSYTEHVSVSGETGLTVSKSDLKTTALKGLKYTDEQIASMSDEEVIEKLQINRKLKKNPKVKSLDEVTQAELLWCMNDVYSKYLDKPEELEKLLNAEIITQYPDLGDAEGKLNGIIKFERHKEDGSSEFLTYVDSGTFDKYVNDGDSKALDYFTLDDTGNVVIASINTTTETLSLNDSEAKISDFTANLSEENKNGDGSYKKVTKNISKQTIYYKNYVQDYTLPFNYLWSLLIIGEDKEFVMELAELAENSEITISIYDNITTNTNTDVYTYKKETRTDTYVRVTPSTTYGIKNVPTKGYWWPADKLTDAGATIGVDDWKNDADYETDETEYKITHTVKSDINAPTIALTKANVWIVDYSVEYTYKEAEVVSDDTNSKEEEDTDFVLDSDASGDSDSNRALLNCEHAQEMTRKTRKYIEDHKPDTTTSRSSFSITGTSSGTNSKKDNSVFDSVIKEDVKTDTSSNLLHPSKKDDTTKSDSSSSKEDVPTTVPEPLLTVLPSYVRCDKYKHKIDRKQTTTSTTTQQSYVAQTPVSNPKDDKDADTDNFVKILCKKKHKKAKNYLTDGTTTSWLWEIMSVNCSDKLIDLTKYLFYKATGTNFGTKEYDFSEFNKTEFNSAGTSGSGFDLYKATLSKEDFVKAMQEYGQKGNEAFRTNFMPYAADIYDWSVAAGVNPELVVITARAEQSFRAPKNAPNNYWGIAVYSQGTKGKGFSSLHDGIVAYANVIKSYGTGGSKESMVMNIYNRRKDSGCNPLGFGLPGTLSGMQSLYSSQDDVTHAQGKREYGNYLLNSVYKGVRSDYERLCVNGGPEHADSAVFTPWEAGEYTAWQVQEKIDMWSQMFGNYGTLSSGEGDKIIETAKSKLGSPYVWGAKGPNSFDCSGFVFWVYKQNGISVPGSTSEYKPYAGSSNEISWSEIQPGDILIIFSGEKGRSVGHAGIYLGNDEYIHSPQTGDVVKISKGAQSKFTHVFRFK